MLSTGVTLTRDAVPIAELTNIGTSHSRDALESTVHSAMRIVPLENGGFEDGLTGWSAWNAPTTGVCSDTQAHSGTYSYHHVGPSTNTGAAQNLSSLVELDTTYTVSAWVYPVSDTDIRIMCVYEVDSGGYQDSPQSGPVGTDAWERLTLTLTIPAGTTLNSCTFYMGGTGEAYFDDVRIHEVGAKTFQRGGIDGEDLPIEGFFLGYDDAATEDIIDDLFDMTDTLASYAISITDADSGLTTITGKAFLTDLNITAGASEHAAFTGTIRWAGVPTYAYVP